MPAIRFKNPLPSNEDSLKTHSLDTMIPPPAELPQFPPLPQLPENRYNIRIEWVRHSKVSFIAYLIIGVFLTFYYSVCFMSQYGTFNKHYEASAVPRPFREPALTRFIMVQWVFLTFSLLFGITFFRRIFMPLYIFAAVMATNGTLVLFVVKVKQLIEGKIRHDDLSLNLVGVLLITATAHNLIYMYSMHIHLNSRAFKRAYYTARLKQLDTKAKADRAKGKDTKDLDSIA